MAQRLAQELEKAQIERLMRDDASRMSAAQAQAGLHEYQSRIAAKVRGNLMRPPGLEGNPEAVFRVRQHPDGTVVSVTLLRSSGIVALDDAIDRAIRRSSPLPLPSGQALFRAELELRFRPNEE
jgi:colicin import membrane protein